MNAGNFINRYMPRLIRKEPLRSQLEGSKNKKPLLINLSEILQLSYHRYVEEYYTQRGWGRFVSRILRWTGFAADATGTYMFWALNGAGFGFKFFGFIIKTLADFVEIAAFRRHVKRLKGKRVKPNQIKVAGLGLGSRLLAYAPYGIGEILDLVTGRRKYTRSVEKLAAKQASKAFLLSLQKQNKQNTN
jgi:hypothetical protein